MLARRRRLGRGARALERAGDGDGSPWEVAVHPGPLELLAGQHPLTVAVYPDRVVDDEIVADHASDDDVVVVADPDPLPPRHHPIPELRDHRVAGPQMGPD